MIQPILFFIVGIAVGWVLANKYSIKAKDDTDKKPDGGK